MLKRIFSLLLALCLIVGLLPAVAIPHAHAEGEDHVHIEVEIPAVPATDTNGGWTAGKKCSVCDEILVEPQGIAPLVAQTERIRLMGYTETYCTSDGKATYFVNQPVDCYYNVTNEDGSVTQVPFKGTNWKRVADRVYDEKPPQSGTSSSTGLPVVYPPSF